MKLAFAASVVGVVLSCSVVHAQPRTDRILSLDQCADQYVLALAPDADLYLSPRADDPDAWLRAEATGRRRVRPTLETALTIRPDIVVRSWGGDPRLLRMLDARGIRVVQIGDAATFSDVRRNTREVAIALGRTDAGRQLVRQMDQTLLEARRSRSRSDHVERSALYLTAGGFTAGQGTLIDAILGAAGYANSAHFSGFGPMSVERMVMAPPTHFVLGFFDQIRSDWRGAGRHPVARRTMRGRIVADLPAAALTCPAWFVADAARMVAQGGGR